MSNQIKKQTNFNFFHKKMKIFQENQGKTIQFNYNNYNKIILYSFLLIKNQLNASKKSSNSKSCDRKKRDRSSF